MASSEFTSTRRGWITSLFFLLTFIFLIQYAFASLRSISFQEKPAGLAESRTLPAQTFSNPALEAPQDISDRDELANILKTAADFLDTFSNDYQFHSLKTLSDDLRAHSLHAHTSSLIASAGSVLKFHGLSDLFKREPSSPTSTSSDSAMSGLMSAANSLFGGIGELTVDTLATPAQYLGDGVGRGATSGLKISNNAQTTPNEPTGINKIADNLGFG